MGFTAPALAKNLLVLFALLLGCLLLFLYLELFPGESTVVTPLDPLHLAAFTYNTTAYTPNSTLSPANATTIPQLPEWALTHTTLYRADGTNASSTYTYAGYPLLYIVNGTSPLLLAAWASSVQDENADGQRVVYSAVRVSSPANRTNTTAAASPPAVLFPSAVPPARTFNVTGLLRGLIPAAFVQLSDGSLYAVAELDGQSDVTGLPHEGAGVRGTGYGRVARQLSTADGSIVGDVCWLEASKYAPGALDGTLYAVPPATPYCEAQDRAELIALLAAPATQPPSSWALESDNHPVVAGDGAVLGEPTHAVPVANNETCRLWRSLGPAAPLNHTLYIECTNNTADATTAGWFNGTGDFEHRGNWTYAAITATNIPDANSRPFLGAFPASSGNARSYYRSYHSDANLTHFLLSNPVPTPDGVAGTRSPLTVATSVDAGLSFSAIAALRSAPTAPRYKGYGKNAGYMYPSAVVRAGGYVNGSSLDVLHVLYAENKEDIVLTSVAVNDLPRNVSALTGPAGSGSDSFGKGFVFFVLCVAALVAVGAATMAVLERDRRARELGDGKWRDKQAPLVNGHGSKHAKTQAGQEKVYYEEEEEEEGEEYETGEEEEEEEEEGEEYEEEERKQPAKNGFVTSTDVARMVTSQPTANKAKRPVQLV